MPGTPYEYISGLILRYMEEPGFDGSGGCEGRRRRRRRRRRRGEEEPGDMVKSRDP